MLSAIENDPELKFIEQNAKMMAPKRIPRENMKGRDFRKPHEHPEEKSQSPPFSTPNGSHKKARDQQTKPLAPQMDDKLHEKVENLHKNVATLPSILKNVENLGKQFEGL